MVHINYQYVGLKLYPTLTWLSHSIQSVETLYNTQLNLLALVVKITISPMSTTAGQRPPPVVM